MRIIVLMGYEYPENMVALRVLHFSAFINLVIVQKVLVFTSEITTGLQKRGIDMVDVCTHVQLVIWTLQGI